LTSRSDRFNGVLLKQTPAANAERYIWISFSS
jgi:hypothetical protein